jgi:hypothetical protein
MMCLVLLGQGDLEEMLPSDFCNGLAWWGKDACYGDKKGGGQKHM